MQTFSDCLWSWFSILMFCDLLTKRAIRTLNYVYRNFVTYNRVGLYTSPAVLSNPPGPAQPWGNPPWKEFHNQTDYILYLIKKMSQYKLSDPNIYSHHNFCNKLYIYKYKIQFIVSWGCVALTPKNSLRISLPLLRIIFNATANIPIIGKIIWEIYMISQAGYFPNWSGDILKNKSFSHHMKWNFVSNIALNLCEK